MPRSTPSPSQTLPDRVSSTPAKELADTFIEQMSRDVFRDKVKEIIGDYIDTVPFLDKVKDYAKRAIDDEVFKNIRYWGGIIIGAAVTALAVRFLVK